MTDKNSQISTNIGYQDYNALQLRLDTQKLHKDIYNFLRGKTQITVYNQETNQYYEEDINEGDALANTRGIQNILNFVVSTVNSHTVQGNTKRDYLDNILYAMNIHLAQQLTLNSDNWGIDKNNRRHILNTIMFMVELFLSRTVDNLERKGYQPIVTKETVISEEKKRGLF